MLLSLFFQKFLWGLGNDPLSIDIEGSWLGKENISTPHPPPSVLPQTTHFSRALFPGARGRCPQCGRAERSTSLPPQSCHVHVLPQEDLVIIFHTIYHVQFYEGQGKCFQKVHGAQRFFSHWTWDMQGNAGFQTAPTPSSLHPPPPTKKEGKIAF